MEEVCVIQFVANRWFNLDVPIILLHVAFHVPSHINICEKFKLAIVVNLFFSEDAE